MEVKPYTILTWTSISFLQKEARNRAINDSGDDELYILPGISNYNLQEQEHQNSQTEVNVLHAPAKGKRMTHAERTCKKEKDWKWKETTLQNQDASASVSG